MLVEFLRSRIAAPVAAFFTLLVTSGALFAQPSITKSFNPNSVGLGVPSVLTFTITNPSASAITGVAFTDNFPANLFVQNPNNLTGSCGAGTITAVGGSGSVSLTGGTIAGSSSCMFSVNVIGTGTNNVTFTNTTGNVTASSGTGNTATATLMGSFDIYAIAKGFSPSSITTGGISKLIFTVTATDPGVKCTPSLSDIEFSDTLPSGVVVATPPNASTTCKLADGTTSSTVVATAGSSTISLGTHPVCCGIGDGTGAYLAGGAQCTFSVDVTATTTGVKNNTTSTPISGCSLITSDDSSPATATLTVSPPPAVPPVITKAFSPATVSIGQTSTLSFTITNPGSVPLTGVGFTDTFPANLFVQTPNGLTGSCNGGTITATAGSGIVSLSGATIAAGSSCTFSVSVVPFVGTPSGTVYTNTTGNVTSTEAGAGNTATAKLTATATSAQFVIGDENATVGNTVTFWGAQWAKDNTLSGGPAPDAFKGFTDTTPANCGGSWTSGPGNSSQPPDSVPLFMAVIVSSTVTKSHSTITGDIPKIVIVRTTPGYGPSPGQTGTGTVVAVACP